VGLLGHLDEGHHAVQQDHRQADPCGLVEQGRRRGGEAAPELQQQRGDPDPGERGGVGPVRLGGQRDQAEPGGEQCLAALEQRRDVVDLAGVHPADDAPVQAVP
jgi:hypothetical protein